MHLSNEAKVLTGIVIATVFLVIGAVFFLSKPEKPVTVDNSILVREDSLKISSSSASLTIVEFGDYQCPACAIAHPGVKKAVEEYPGKINFVYRHFPLAQHKNAEIAARAAEAANIQGKVWEMHDLLFDRQPEWETAENPTEIFKKYAQDFGMDVDKFVEDLESEKARKKVANDLTDGNTIGVSSTPTFYFNSELHKGGVSYQDFKTAIEKYLK